VDHQLENREIEDLEGVVPLPGSLGLLSSIPPGHWTIVTSSTRPLAEARLRATALPIPVRIITSSDVNNGKPHPEPFLKAAGVLGFRAEECLVLEDAPAGVEAGKAAVARVIALRTTAADNDLLRAGAGWVLDNCSAVSAELKEAKIFLTLHPITT